MILKRLSVFACWLCLLPAMILPAMPTHMTVQAVDVFRCVGDNGSVIYSESPCGPNAEHKSYEGAAPLSGSDTPPVSPQQQLQRYRKGVQEIEDLIGREAPEVRPAKAPSPGPDCRGVTRLQLRNARVRKQVMTCHSQSDVESIYGVPDRVETFSDRKQYDTRWTYYFDNGNQQIYFSQGRVSRINRLYDNDG